ncbi:MAG: hypothetical protein Q9N34_06520 [Aquificota bacterium]|nr:hypothetical protein [Aquificota bacterium]
MPRKKILEIVRRKFQREGGGIEEDALELLVELCGGDLMVLRQEVEKILTYAGKEKITKEVVESVCSPWGDRSPSLTSIDSGPSKGIRKGPANRT